MRLCGQLVSHRCLVRAVECLLPGIFERRFEDILSTWRNYLLRKAVPNLLTDIREIHSFTLKASGQVEENSIISENDVSYDQMGKGGGCWPAFYLFYLGDSRITLIYTDESEHTNKQCNTLSGCIFLHLSSRHPQISLPVISWSNWVAHSLSSPAYFNPSNFIGNFEVHRNKYPIYQTTFWLFDASSYLNPPCVWNLCSPLDQTVFPTELGTDGWLVESPMIWTLFLSINHSERHPYLPICLLHWIKNA